MTTINLAESQNLPFALPAPLFRVPYTLRRSTVLGRSTFVESPLQIHPFYAKQTQFPKSQNEIKLLFNKGL